MSLLCSLYSSAFNLDPKSQQWSMSLHSTEPFSFTSLISHPISLQIADSAPPHWPCLCFHTFCECSSEAVSLPESFPINHYGSLISSKSSVTSKKDLQQILDLNCKSPSSTSILTMSNYSPQIYPPLKYIIFTNCVYVCTQKYKLHNGEFLPALFNHLSPLLKQLLTHTKYSVGVY